MRICAARLPHGRWAAARCSLQQAAASRRSRCWSGGRTALFYRSCCPALPCRQKPGGHRRPQHPGVFSACRHPLRAVPAADSGIPLHPACAYGAAAGGLRCVCGPACRCGCRLPQEGIWLQNGRLTLRWQHGFHLHDICVLCPVPALTALQSPWAAAVRRTNLTLTFPGGVKCRVRSVKCSELPFLLF